MGILISTYEEGFAQVHRVTRGRVLTTTNVVVWTKALLLNQVVPKSQKRGGGARAKDRKEEWKRKTIQNIKDFFEADSDYSCVVASKSTANYAGIK